jgi:excisionase family DNA binding protein
MVLLQSAGDYLFPERKGAVIPGQSPEPYVTRQEIAAHLKVSLVTIDRMIRRGELPSIKLTRRLRRFKVSEVEEALKQSVQMERLFKR